MLITANPNHNKKLQWMAVVAGICILGVVLTRRESSLRVFLSAHAPRAWSAFGNSKKPNEERPRDLNEVRSEVEAMSDAELSARRKSIDEEIHKEELIEKFNLRELDANGLAKLRQLAFERSLIALKLFEKTN